ncbi:hypothetical protein WCD74_07510 [Actinomycetospora sp. OC33-EN08]|uniref:Uncharacterized protein n=1 Tax=Actinomycetospora aurantiaca TaxID=3129233 RepID=A0ABU8MJV6_9PSEU
MTGPFGTAANARVRISASGAVRYQLQTSAVTAKPLTALGTGMPVNEFFIGAHPLVSTPDTCAPEC